MKPKVFDFDTDWKYIKDTQLGFLIENDNNIVLGMDHRYSGLVKKSGEPDPNAPDPRETILIGLINMAV